MGAAVAGVHRGKTMSLLTVTAPAKINLTLEVLGKRPDGYHEIRSVLQTVNLCDILHFRENDKITLSSRMPGWSAGESLVAKAVDLLQKAGGVSGGAVIDIEKRIPLMSGLGGDSSDAAAILRGLNEFWKLGLPRGKLRELAAQLGSDVAFFLYGGTARAEGRGEVITPLPAPAQRWVILVMPDVPRKPGKTKELYASLKPGHYTDGQITERLATALKTDRHLTASMLFNTFENVAFDRFPGLKVYKEHIIKLGAPHVHLAGSGPALFTMMEDKARAEDLYTRCQQQQMEAYLAETPADAA
jgi:4-diphosphocytidyl-2-C-methyl-D-erythritol kinase